MHVKIVRLRCLQVTNSWNYYNGMRLTCIRRDIQSSDDHFIPQPFTQYSAYYFVDTTSPVVYSDVMLNV